MLSQNGTISEIGLNTLNIIFLHFDAITLITGYDCTSYYSMNNFQSSNFDEHVKHNTYSTGTSIMVYYYNNDDGI